MAKYTELFAEYLEGGGSLPAAVVTSKRNEAELIKQEFHHLPVYSLTEIL